MLSWAIFKSMIQFAMSAGRVITSLRGMSTGHAFLEVSGMDLQLIAHVSMEDSEGRGEDG